MPGTESVSHHDLVVCACGEQEYTAGDAIDAAIFRGELDRKWEKFLSDAAAENRADELDLDLDESAISAAAEAFRYQHDLITAEETEAWLANRGLTFDDFSDYFARQYCASAVREDISPEKVGYDSASPELRKLFVADLILSGELDHMTTQLMWRLAARCAEKEIAPEAVAAEERNFLDRQGIKRAQLGDWLERLGRDAKWFNEMLALESAYRKRCETLLVPRARERELATLRLPLTRFETEVIELESRDAAQEALFCVREDGMSMEEVAAEGRYPYRRADFLLEDIPAEGQQRFLSVSAGDVLEPLPRGDGFELCRIISKVEPQPDDPAVKSRIDQRLLYRHFSELASRYLERRLGGVSTLAK
ncbi:MAG: hypothetical protein DME50_02615 [Verrucomicrobia bacterium]|nr:MAG: hypothetical protein DME50_02615 [Verrucomicrobiota bacterium]